MNYGTSGLHKLVLQPNTGLARSPDERRHPRITCLCRPAYPEKPPDCKFPPSLVVVAAVTAAAAAAVPFHPVRPEALAPPFRVIAAAMACL